MINNSKPDEEAADESVSAISNQSSKPDALHIKPDVVASSPVPLLINNHVDTSRQINNDSNPVALNLSERLASDHTDDIAFASLSSSVSTMFSKVTVVGDNR